MTYFIDRLARVRWWLLALLIGLAPFHAFLVTWLKIPGLSVWREVLVFTISIIVFTELLVQKYYKKVAPLGRVNKVALLRLGLLDYLILAYAILALAWLPFQPNKLQWLFGFRFDVLPFLFFFFVRRVEWPRVELLLKIFFAGAFIVLIFGLAHALILPQNFLTYFGYTAYQGEFQQTLGVPACQYLEHVNRVCRAMSTFGGPTRYGTYLLLVLGLLVGYKSKKIQFSILLGLVFANIILTFSRSIWIGLFAMGIFAFFWYIPKKIKLKALVALIFVVVAGILGSMWFSAWKGERSWPPPVLKTIFVRESSTDVHADLFKKGIELSAQNPLGMGLGTIGPASVRFEKLLTENWYLQIALEMGWLGLILFLAILIELSRKFLRDRENFIKTGLFLCLLGISVTGLFTHSFEETTTALLLFGFAGMNFYAGKS